ncbi:MAG: tRNA 2-thiouridine(34) synthase MnmA [Parcubacteria group bacterium]
MPRPRVLIALSGGVDSSVAAALLVREGYDCAGVFFELWSPRPKQGKGWENNCCTLEAYRDAKRVAAKLAIPLFRVNLAREFKSKVVQSFLDEYAAGRTPNPCVICNSEVRFGVMFDKALHEYAADFLATGHYAIRDHVDSWKKAQILSRPKVHRLYTAKDNCKDQSYFLYRLNQIVLGRLLFPLGGLRKSTEVRALAREIGLPTASKHDSQEICFIPRGGVTAFLKDRLRPRPAVVLDEQGQRLGCHAGAPLVTLGQRRGLGSFSKEPHFVVEKNINNATITVTTDRRDKRLYANAMRLERACWITEEPSQTFEALARGRHGQDLFAVRVERQGSGWLVKPLEQVKRIAPGQSLVIVREGEVLGGGFVQEMQQRATLSNHAHVRVLAAA